MGTLLVDDPAALRNVLASGKRRAAIHCEDEARLRERRHLLGGDGATAATHPLWRDEKTAIQATHKLLKAARETGGRVHVLHVTTAEEAALLARNKDIATMEVTPQHLTLEAPDCYQRLGSYAQIRPPLLQRFSVPALEAAFRP